MTVKTALVLGVLAAMLPVAASAQSYKGLELKVTGVEHATNVSLTDCPPGQNIVRGVIKPGDTNEFASVKVEFNATPAFTATMLPSPVLYDESGKAYKTAQSFAEIGAGQRFSCTFSFRVPKGTALARLTLDSVSVDLRKVPQ
jgi:hypothetical protein